jgi:hypothetical protein
MSDLLDRPKHWPENPYFENAMGTIKSDSDYAKAIPDSKLRSAVAWYLSNRAWELAANTILEAIQPIDIKDKLPRPRQRCLYWHSGHSTWHTGTWYDNLAMPPGLFQGYYNAYVFDGTATHWLPMPEPPEVRNDTA